MANSDSEKMATDQNHASYADDAKARRVLIVGSSGTVGTEEINYESTWTITRGDGQPDSETRYTSSSGTETRTFTYDINDNMIKRTAWSK